MNFPQFWARGSKGNITCWRWSFQSVAEAQSLANQAVEKLVNRFQSIGYPPRHEGYYPDRPLREQVVQVTKNDREEISALVTRNSYGCLVLNTARVMFVDIDFPEQERPAGVFKRLFGKTDPPSPVHPQTAAMARIEDWTRSHSEWGWRIYRTCGGLRLLAMQDLVDANSEIADSVFASLGADPLYRKLCRTQNCYRARLTPKPWRCGVHRKPQRWPWANDKAEQRFRKWEAHYLSRSSNWATCELLHQIGNRHVDPEVQAVVTLHDIATRVGSKLQLA